MTKEEEERQARANKWAQEGTQPEGRSKRKVLVVHGAGLCMRGKAQIEKFGTLTLADYERHILHYAEQHHLDIEFFQSNSEGSVIDRLYAAHDDGDVDGAIINPGGTIYLIQPLFFYLFIYAIHCCRVHEGLQSSGAGVWTGVLPSGGGTHQQHSSWWHHQRGDPQLQGHSAGLWHLWLQHGPRWPSQLPPPQQHQALVCCFPISCLWCKERYLHLVRTDLIKEWV